MSVVASRRAVVAGAGAAVGASAVGLAPAAHAADYAPGSWPATDLLPEGDRHLVSRFSYAVTPALAQQVRSAGGARAWFEAQLATAYDGSADNLADWWPHLHLRPTAVWELQTSGTRFGYRVMYDYGRRLLVRRLISPRPVLEVMTEFWENYLNVPANGDSQFTWRARYGDVIRSHALGRFDKLLQDADRAPRDADLPRRRQLDRRPPEREPRPGAARAAHRRRGRLQGARRQGRGAHPHGLPGRGPR